MLLPIVSMDSSQSTTTCLVCQMHSSLGNKYGLKELDKQIEQLETLGAGLENIVKAMPVKSEPPAEMQQLAFSPLSAYKSIQTLLAELKSLRLKAVTNTDSEERLLYELKKSLEAENYEKSAQIRDELKKKSG
jgi:hypothetical protein